MADTTEVRARRKVRTGIVTSDARDRTIAVDVPIQYAHPRYDKVVRRSLRLHVHDEGNEARKGDRVRVMETKPISRQKHWRLVEIVERAR